MKENPLRQRLERLLSDPMARNAAALYALQIADYAVPLVTLSYLARVLGPESWGEVLYAQGFALWLLLVFEYGFQLSATREIARRRDDKAEVGRIVAGVAGASVVLTAASVVVAAIAQLAIPAFRAKPSYLWLAWAIALTGGVRPLWYFQGIERMEWPSLWNGISRVAVAVALFVFVRSSDDAYWVLVLQVIASGAVVAVMWRRLYREIPYARPSRAQAFAALASGWRLFLFRGAVSFYTTANTVLLGWFVPAAAVTYYAAPERLIKAGQGLIWPASQVLYPRMNRLAGTDGAEAARMARVALAVIGGGGLAAGLAVIALAPWIVSWQFGAGYEAAVPVLRLLALLLPLVAASNVLGIQWMLPQGMDGAFNVIIIAAGVVNLGLAFYLAPRYGPYGMALAVVVAEALVLFGQWLAIARSPNPFWKIQET